MTSDISPSKEKKEINSPESSIALAPKKKFVTPFRRYKGGKGKILKIYRYNMELESMNYQLEDLDLVKKKLRLRRMEVKKMECFGYKEIYDIYESDIETVKALATIIKSTNKELDFSWYVVENLAIELVIS